MRRGRAGRAGRVVGGGRRRRRQRRAGWCSCPASPGIGSLPATCVSHCRRRRARKTPPGCRGRRRRCAAKSTRCFFQLVDLHIMHVHVHHAVGRIGATPRTRQPRTRACKARAVAWAGRGQGTRTLQLLSQLHLGLLRGLLAPYALEPLRVRLVRVGARRRGLGLLALLAGVEVALALDVEPRAPSLLCGDGRGCGRRRRMRMGARGRGS